MICGLSHFNIRFVKGESLAPRCSPFMGCVHRSIAATATFCVTASLTACLLHDALVPLPGDPSLGTHGSVFLAGGVAALISTLAAARVGVYARQAVAFCSAVGFAFGLRLSNLNDSRRVLGFLLTPAHTAFDPSLVYLAVGAIPLTSLLYHTLYYRTGVAPVPKKGRVDGRLLAGAALFGVGWGIEGICRKLLLGRHAARLPLIDNHFDVCSWSRVNQFRLGPSDGDKNQTARDLVDCCCHRRFSGSIITVEVSVHAIPVFILFL